MLKSPVSGSSSLKISGNAGKEKRLGAICYRWSNNPVKFTALTPGYNRNQVRWKQKLNGRLTATVLTARLQVIKKILIRRFWKQYNGKHLLISELPSPASKV